MKLQIAVALMTIMSLPASAACYGTGAFQQCYDLQSGNNYTVNRYGNTTQMNGYNSSTGSSWSQNSTTFGDTTQHNGYDADGNSWNMTQRDNGYSTTYSGTDSNGDSFFKSCTKLLGCY